jgi:DUF4097 and DUF4098 domain-containing protein YvlB
MKARVLAGAAFLLLSTVATADVKETEEHNFNVDPGARISLENINGDIVVNGGSGDNVVKVVARKKAGSQEYLDEIKVVIDADDDYIRIETRHPKSDGWFNWGNDSSGSVSYELTVSENVDLDSIETVNGDVEIRAVSGKVRASTVNGSLHVFDLASDVNLETVNGSVKAQFAAMGEGQRVNAEAVNGKIMVLLPADASASINAETVNGSIDADDFGLEAEKGFVGRDLSGDIGAGGARITLDTVNGSIKVRRK